MAGTRRSFVLSHIFDNISQLTCEKSPTESHCGYKWCVSIERTGQNFGVYLHRVTKEEDAPPVSTSFSISITSSDGENLQTADIQNVYLKNGGHGLRSFAKRKDVLEKYTSNDKLAVSIHVDIIKIFTISAVRREFILTKIFEDSSKLDEKLNPVETHFGNPWSFVVKRYQDCVEVELHCKKETRSNLWWIDAKFTCKMKVNEDVVFEKAAAFTFTFNHNKTPSNFLHWCHKLKKLDISAEKGNGKNTNKTFNVEVHVEILNMANFSQKRKADVDPEEDEYSDVCLEVDGQEFKACRAILSQQSPVFRSMFSTSSRAKRKKVVIEDADATTFRSFLMFFYGEKLMITSKTVRNLLILADRYEVPRVTGKCLKFLINSSTVDVKTKLELADHFDLPELQENALISLKTLKEVKSLRESMTNITSSTAEALLDKTLSLAL